MRRAPPSTGPAAPVLLRTRGLPSGSRRERAHDRVHRRLRAVWWFPSSVPDLLLSFRALTLARALRYAHRMGSDHYFTAAPASPENLRTIRVTLAGRELELTTAGGVFSPDRLDAGTSVLLANMPPVPPGGNLLDLG